MDETATKETDLFIEMLQVLLNNLLYARNVYPSAIYEKRKIYGLPVFVSIYPTLNDYLVKILLTVKELKNQNQLTKIQVVFYENENEVIEIFTFNLMDKPVNFETDAYLFNFENEIRTSIQKTNEKLKTFKKLPKDTKFKIVLETTQSAFVKLTNKSTLEDFQWLEQISSSSNKKIKTKSSISSVDSFGLDVYVEYF